MINQKPNLILDDKPNVCYLKELNNIAGELKELRKKVEAPIKEGMIKETAEKVRQLEQKITLLKQLVTNEKTAAVDGPLGEKNGKWKVWVITSLDIVAFTGAIAAFIVDGLSDDNSHGWTIAKWTVGAVALAIGGFAAYFGWRYSKNKEKAEELKGFTGGEVQRVKRLLSFLSALESIEKGEEVEKQAPLKIKNMINKYDNIGEDYQKDLPPKDRWIVVTLQLLPQNHPLRKKLKKIHELSKSSSNQEESSSIEIIENKSKPQITIEKENFQGKRKNFRRSVSMSNIKPTNLLDVVDGNKLAPRKISWANNFDKVAPKFEGEIDFEKSAMTENNSYMIDDLETEKQEKSLKERILDLENELGFTLPSLQFTDRKVEREGTVKTFENNNRNENSEDFVIEMGEEKDEKKNLEKIMNIKEIHFFTDDDDTNN